MRWLVPLVLLMLPLPTAQAGTEESPELADPAGDAIVYPGVHATGPVADMVDLRGLWFNESVGGLNVTARVTSLAAMSGTGDAPNTYYTLEIYTEVRPPGHASVFLSLSAEHYGSGSTAGNPGWSYQAGNDSVPGDVGSDRITWTLDKAALNLTRGTTLSFQFVTAWVNIPTYAQDTQDQAYGPGSGYVVQSDPPRSPTTSGPPRTTSSTTAPPASGTSATSGTTSGPSPPTSPGPPSSGEASTTETASSTGTSSSSRATPASSAALVLGLGLALLGARKR